ncbi:unnamed protein product [Toxocara canis]|uniref:Uncharacterized protein n=1 Tax=Toxocara canis TaxID=6265 RepID=A0A183TZ60_TOXCA|nr:unnamed protein product [Toxocara canis]
MEQYRMMDNKKNAKEKQTLVKRAAKALIPKSPKKNSTTKANDKIIPNESTAEESSTYSTDEPPHHGSSAAVEGQSTTARITSLPSSFSDQAIKMPSNKTSVLNFPRNGTVRITTTEKRGSAFPIRFASLRLRPHSGSSNLHHNVNPGCALERQPSTYDNLNARINA